MPLKPTKKTVGATVTDEVRDKIKRVAELKHWSVAQTLGLFIDAYWEQWEKDLGVFEAESSPKSRKSKSQ
jgi:hypothetical protein